MSGKLWLVLLLLCAPLWALLAQESDEQESFEIGEIVVTATRTKVESLEAPGHVTVITAEEMKESGAGSVAEALSRQSGLEVNDYGAEGGLKTARIRGSEPEQVLILLDGLRLNDVRDGGRDLSLIPLDAVERIEVVRGGLSAVYGADAASGVINIITKEGSERRINLKVENGSYIPRNAVEVSEGPVQKATEARPLDLLDTQKVNLQLSGSIGGFDLLTSGSFTRANNGFIWYDDRYAGGYRRRTNADMLGADLYVRADHPLGDGELGLSGMFVWQDKGSPGAVDPAGVSLSTDARQGQISAVGQLTYRADRFLSDLLTLDAGLSYRFEQLDYEDAPSIDDTHRVHSFGIDASQQWQVSDRFSLVYGGSLAVDLADSTKIGWRQRVSAGGFLETPLVLLSDLTVTPSIRYDLVSDFPDSLTGRLSIVYRLSKEAALKASAATSYRAPTLNELYWPADPWGTTEGNPNLKPERGISGDLGLSLQTGRLDLDGYLFVRYMVDMIDWAEDAMGVWRPTNIHKAFYPGAELTVGFEPVGRIHLSAGYTFLYSFVLDTYSLADNKRVSYTPVHAATAGIEYRDARNQAGLDAEFTGERYTDAANTASLDSILMLNAHYRRALTDRLFVHLGVRNLLNQTRESVDGYIMPPLSFWTGIEASL